LSSAPGAYNLVAAGALDDCVLRLGDLQMIRRVSASKSAWRYVIGHEIDANTVSGSSC